MEFFKKNLKFIIAGFIVVILGAVYFLSARQVKIEVNGSKYGEKIYINDIYKNPDRKYAEGVEFKRTDDYLMNFYARDNLFIITIFNSDVETARQKAEKDFLNILGINQNQACQLSVQVLVPLDVNENYGGQNLGLTYCQPSAQPADSDSSLFQKLLNIFKNPLTVALGIAVIMIGGIIFYTRR